MTAFSCAFSFEFDASSSCLATIPNPCCQPIFLRDGLLPNQVTCGIIRQKADPNSPAGAIPITREFFQKRNRGVTRKDVEKYVIFKCSTGAI